MTMMMMRTQLSLQRRWVPTFNLIRILSADHTLLMIMATMKESLGKERESQVTKSRTWCENSKETQTGLKILSLKSLRRLVWVKLKFTNGDGTKRERPLEMLQSWWCLPFPNLVTYPQVPHCLDKWMKTICTWLKKNITNFSSSKMKKKNNNTTITTEEGKQIIVTFKNPYHSLMNNN